MKSKKTVRVSCGLFVDTEGNVYSPEGLPRTQYFDAGYYKVSYKKKFYKVHRLVAEAFLGNLELTVNHKNGNKLDNRLENLEMVSLSDNLKHAFENDLHCNPKQPVVAINAETAESVKFESVMDAVRCFPKAHNANIYRAIRTGRTCADHYWSFYES